MAKNAAAAAETSKVRFTVTSNTNDSLTGMIQTEDQDENERRVFLDDSGVAAMTLPPGKYTFVWSVKMTPVQRHRYSITVEQLPGGGAGPEELRKRPSEQTTTGAEDVGFDEFTL